MAFCTTYVDNVGALMCPACGSGELAAAGARACPRCGRLVCFDARLADAERAALSAAAQALAAQVDSSLLLRRTGAPAKISHDSFTRLYQGGVWAIDPRGAQHGLAPPPSRWLPVVVVVMLLVSLCSMTLLAHSAGSSADVEGRKVADWVTRMLVWMTAALGVVSIVGFVAARFGAKTKLVIDTPQRLVRVEEGGVTVLTVPFALACSTCVRVNAKPSYSDHFDALLNLGFAELWIHEAGDEDEARWVAQTVAHYVGVPFDPEVQRTSE